MTDTLETPRVLTVDTDKAWQVALRRRLTVHKVEFEQTKDADDAIEQLNSGDFSAVIMGGLNGSWRMMVDEAVRLEVRPVLLSSSTLVIHQAKVQGVTAFHKNRPLTQEGIDPIVRAAITPEEPSR